MNCKWNKVVKGEQTTLRSLLKFKNGEIVIGFFKPSANMWFVENLSNKQRTVSGNEIENPIIEYKRIC